MKKPERILICPVEICGNMQLLANAFRRKGVFCTAANYKIRDGRRYMNDVDLTLDYTSSKGGRIYKQTLFFLFALANYDVYHFFYGRSLLPKNRDLPILRWLNKKIFMHFRGEDCLNYDIFDYWRDRAFKKETMRPPVNTPEQAKRIHRLDKHCQEFFVSTPSLEQALPHSIMVPQVIDLEKVKYAGVSEPANGDPIKIVHPTSSPWKFGTDFVEKSIDELKGRGYNIDFQIVQNVPHEEAVKIFREADIGVDTMLHGWYGNISIEFMALGKPVVCFVRNKWKHVRPTLPIHESHPWYLTDRLAELIEDASLRRKLGEAGRAYVENYHDANKITDQLLDIYAMH